MRIPLSLHNTRKAQYNNESEHPNQFGFGSKKSEDCVGRAHGVACLLWPAISYSLALLVVRNRKAHVNICHAIRGYLCARWS